MGEKQRWNDPANEAQVSYVKVGSRFASLVMLLVLAAVIKIAIDNKWIETFRALTG
jgi:hypothetical protein